MNLKREEERKAAQQRKKKWKRQEIERLKLDNEEWLVQVSIKRERWKLWEVNWAKMRESERQDWKKERVIVRYWDWKKKNS